MGWGWGVDTTGEEKMKRRCNELGGGGVDTMEEEKMMKRNCNGVGRGVEVDRGRRR